MVWVNKLYHVGEKGRIMDRYKYAVNSAPGIDEFEKALNELGERGWKFCHMEFNEDGSIWYLVEKAFLACGA